MKFASLSNGSFKRLRETPVVDLRPSKKSSPTPSDSESDNEHSTNSSNHNWRDPLDQVFRRRNNHLSQNRRRRLRNKGLSVQTVLNSNSPADNDAITPDSTPVKDSARWEDARINSVVQLATMSPHNEDNVTRHLADLTLVTSCSSPATPPTSPRPTVEPHPIFEMPEIVENILRFVDAGVEVPGEKPYARRKPLSFEHAMLVYKDEKRALEAWNSKSQASMHNGGDTKNSDGNKEQSVMHNCMRVNRLWFHISLELLLEKFHFKDMTRFRQFLHSNRGKKLIKPKVMVLYKFHKLQQFELNQLSQFLSCESLKWLEFYICPDVVPPPAWIHKFKSLEKLALPGNKKIDDKFLIQVSTRVSNLKILDLRACDNVTDSGIIAMALRCPQLQACNLGRHRNGSNITSLAVAALARNTNVETLGTAGCKITDAGLWELAQLRGNQIKRLSLNNCDLLTNHSIPTLLAFNYFPNLAVLELRHVDQVTEVKHLVKFKLWRRSQNLPVLIEGCERLTRLIYHEENRIRRANSRLALEDMSAWVNADSTF